MTISRITRYRIATVLYCCAFWVGVYYVAKWGWLAAMGERVWPW